jgi:hypothetical protein
MRLWQTYLCIPGLLGFEIKGTPQTAVRKKYETDRSHSASNLNKIETTDGTNRRRGFIDRQKEVEACAAALDVPLSAVAKQRYVHVDSPVSS